MPLTAQKVTAANNISSVNTIRDHFNDVRELARFTIESARSGKVRVTQARLRFSHQSLMTIRKGKMHRYRNRLAGGNSLHRTSMSITDNAN